MFDKKKAAELQERISALEAENLQLQESLTESGNRVEELEAENDRLVAQNMILGADEAELTAAQEATALIRDTFGVEEISADSLQSAISKRVNQALVDAGHEALESGDDKDALTGEEDHLKTFEGLSGAARTAYFRKHKEAILEQGKIS